MTREIFCGDSLKILPTTGGYDALITSFPAAHDLNLHRKIEKYKEWTTKAIATCFDAVQPKGVAIFYQTDEKIRGEIYSKATQIITIATALRFRLLWHKIVLRHSVGAVDLYRPGYSHMLAFSRLGKVGRASPDVIPAGRFLWPYGMGVEAAEFACRYARHFGPMLIDPFCGYGTVLAAGERAGFKRIYGIDKDARCCARSRKLLL